MEQDFNKRIAIVVRDDLPAWQAMNALAVGIFDQNEQVKTMTKPFSLWK